MSLKLHLSLGFLWRVGWASWFSSITLVYFNTVCIQAFFSEFGYPAFESFHEIKVIHKVTRRKKSVACGQTLSEHSHKLKRYEWSEWILCCGVISGLHETMYQDMQPLSAVRSCSNVVGIFISLPKILIEFVS